MTTVTATDIQNNFGKYLQLVQTGEEVIILRNGLEMARLISHDKTVSFLSDCLAADAIPPKNAIGIDITRAVEHATIRKISPL